MSTYVNAGEYFFFNQLEKATQPKWVENDASASKPGLVRNSQLLRFLAERDFGDLFQPRVILTFDLTPKLIVSCCCPVNHLCQSASELVY